MKLKNWILAAGFLVPFVACAPANTVKPNDPVGNVISNYCKNIIEESVSKFAFEENKEERMKLLNDLNKCIEVPETHEELEDKLVKSGYVYRKNLFGKVTKPVKKIVDNGKEYDVVTYKPLEIKKNSFDDPYAFSVYGKIFVNENAIKSIADKVLELYKSKELDVFPVRINARFYDSLKGRNDEETRQNIYNNIMENYIQHELEHFRNNDKEGFNVPNEVKAYIGSFIKAQSYNIFIDLDEFIQTKDTNYGKAAERIFDLFKIHGVPKEKIPEMSLQELKKVAEEIYKEL
jgi:hypothetical protein